jgi:hypothetical protein
VAAVAYFSGAMQASEDGGVVRIELDSLEKKADNFIAAMQKHGFVILTDIDDEGKELYGTFPPMATLCMCMFLSFLGPVWIDKT